MKVLFVDDEQDIRRVGDVSLSKVGSHDVTLASNVDEAMQALQQSRPDVILLDVMMPGRDGLSMLRDLRSDPSYRELPVVFMTAKVQKSEVDEYMEAGANGVIRKPFDPMTLPDELEVILARN